MTNAALRAVAMNATATSWDTHRDIPTVSWFMNSGYNESYLPTFTPDIGTTDEWVRGLYSTSTSYVSNKQDPFWPDDNGNKGGFSIYKTNTRTGYEFNYAIYGGVGVWMPCPIFKSVSWYWNNAYNSEANFVPKRLGLILKNWKTDEEKKWGYDGYRTYYPEAEDKLYYSSNTAKTQSVRDLGPDWFIYGALFNFKSNETSVNQTIQSSIKDFKLGYGNSVGPGTYRMLLTQNQSWADLKSMMNSGIVRYPQNS